MKKKILSIALALCMVLTMMPMATGVAWAAALLEGVTFSHAYDVQRDPAYPTRGKTIKLSGLKGPIMDSDRTHGDSVGNWTLTKAGTYAYMESSGKATENLTSIVTGIVSAYSDQNVTLDKNTIIIHELKKNGTHLAYGVVVAYDITDGYALFQGDTLSGSGAGYFLSTSEKSGDFSVIASTIVEDNARSLSISLDTSGTHDFGRVDWDYSAPPCKEVTVLNNGNGATGELTVSISDDEKFNLSELQNDNKIASINVGDTGNFKVTPVTGLGGGTYTATVTVSGTDIDPQSFNVSFTVNKAPLSSIAVTNAPTKTTYIAGDNFDTTGMVVTATYNDDSTAVVNGYTVTDGNNLTAGKTSVTISYTEGGVTKTITQNITVNAASKVLSRIAVTTPPTKTTYIEGNNFDTTGMVVTATYNDDSTAVVNGYTVTDGNNLTAGKTSVTISYTEGGVTKTITQNITVKAPSSSGSYTPTIQKPTVITDDGAEGTLSFYGDKLTIKVTDDYELADVILNGVSKGKVTELTGLKTGDKVEVKTEKKQEETKEPTKEEIVAALKEQQLVARSKLTTSKSGRKAVLITWYDKNGNEVTFDGVEIYRSTKRDSGYGDEPIFVSKTGKYYNTAITEGTRYYYKVRGYVIIDGQKYYTDYSLKAIRTIK